MNAPSSAAEIQMAVKIITKEEKHATANSGKEIMLKIQKNITARLF